MVLCLVLMKQIMVDFLHEKQCVTIISAEWNGDTLVTNSGGGKVSLSGFSAASNSQVLFDVVDDAQTDGLNEPILLATADGNMQTQATAEFTGRTED